jgi:putative nucleotidyltransferase with HDIG domain
MAVEPSVTPVLVPARVDVRPRARVIGVLTVAVVAVAAQAIAAWVLIDGSWGASAEPGAFLVLLALLAVNEALSVNVFDDATASPGEVPVLAAGVLCGPLAVPALEITVTLAAAIARRQLNWWAFFNASVYTLSGVAGAAVLAVAFAITSSPWLLLALGGVAGLVYFVLNGVLCALGMTICSGEPFRAFFARSVAWLLPYYVGYGVLAAALVLAHQAMGMVGLLVFAMPALAMVVSIGQYTRRTERMVGELRVANSSLETLLAENRGLLAAISRQHIATIRGLANAIDAKDPYTAGHTERVALYSAGIAEALGLTEEQRRDLEHGALLHDIGKIGVSDAVLTKPGPLTDHEWAEMRRHPETACAILEGIDLPPAVISVIRHHHENLDGTGYPDRLTAAEIGIEARIARVADAFDAMTSTRPYRRALTVGAARAELRRHAGTQFCPIVVAALERQLERRVLDHALDAARELDVEVEAKSA